VNVLHVIPSVAAKEGGPSFAIKAITEALARKGVQVTIATTGDADADPGTNDPGYRQEAVASERDYSIVCFRR